MTNTTDELMIAILNHVNEPDFEGFCEECGAPIHSSDHNDGICTACYSAMEAAQSVERQAVARLPLAEPINLGVTDDI